MAAAGCGRTRMQVQGEVWRRGDLGASGGPATSLAGLRGDRAQVLHPLAEVDVTVYQSGRDQWDPVVLGRTRTDPDGRYEVSFSAQVFPTEHLYVLFDREGYLAGRESALLVPGRRYRVDTVLAPEGPEDRARFGALPTLEEFRARGEHDLNERLGDPLAISNLSFLHALVHVPTLEAGYTRTGGAWRVAMGQEVFSGSASAGARPGQQALNGYRGSFHNLRMVLGHGLARRLDLEAWLDLARLETQNRTDVQVFRDNDPAEPLFTGDTPAGNQLVGEGFHMRGAGARARWMVLQSRGRGFSGALVAGGNLGIGSDHFVSKGSPDAWGGVALSQRVGAALLHLGGGHVVVGPQGVFTDRGAGRQRIEMKDVQYGGVALAVPFRALASTLARLEGCTAIAQVQGHTSAFDNLAYLEDPPALGLLGLRARLFEFVLEASAGAGLNPSSSDAVGSFNASLQF